MPARPANYCCGNKYDSFTGSRCCWGICLFVVPLLPAVAMLIGVWAAANQAEVYRYWSTPKAGLLALDYHLAEMAELGRPGLENPWIDVHIACVNKGGSYLDAEGPGSDVSPADGSSLVSGEGSGENGPQAGGVLTYSVYVCSNEAPGLRRTSRSISVVFPDEEGAEFLYPVLPHVPGEESPDAVLTSHATADLVVRQKDLYSGSRKKRTVAPEESISLASTDADYPEGYVLEIRISGDEGDDGDDAEGEGEDGKGHGCEHGCGHGKEHGSQGSQGSHGCRGSHGSYDCHESSAQSAAQGVPVSAPAAPSKVSTVTIDGVPRITPGALYVDSNNGLCLYTQEVTVYCDYSPYYVSFSIPTTIVLTADNWFGRDWGVVLANELAPTTLSTSRKVHLDVEFSGTLTGGSGVFWAGIAAFATYLFVMLVFSCCCYHSATGAPPPTCCCGCNCVCCPNCCCCLAHQAACEARRAESTVSKRQESWGRAGGRVLEPESGSGELGDQSDREVPASTRPGRPAPPAVPAPVGPGEPVGSPLYPGLASAPAVAPAVAPVQARPLIPVLVLPDGRVLPVGPDGRIGNFPIAGVVPVASAGPAGQAGADGLNRSVQIPLPPSSQPPTAACDPAALDRASELPVGVCQATPAPLDVEPVPTAIPAECLAPAPLSMRDVSQPDQPGMRNPMAVPPPVLLRYPSPDPVAGVPADSSP